MMRTVGGGWQNFILCLETEQNVHHTLSRTCLDKLYLRGELECYDRLVSHPFFARRAPFPSFRAHAMTSSADT